MKYFSVVFCLLVIISDHVIQANSANEYIEVDGILVLKREYEEALKAKQKQPIFSHQSERDIESILEEKEHADVAKQLPKLCHVCRLFVEDFMKFLKENATLIAEESEENAKYIYNEHFAYEGFEEVCNGMKGYRVTRMEKFRYVKEASILRQVFNEFQEKSKVRTWMYNIREEDIDDPTGEIRRIKEECIKLKTTYRKDLLRWFEYNQDSMLIDWFCKKEYLKNENQDCLTETKLKPMQKKDVNIEEIPPHNEL